PGPGRSGACLPAPGDPRECAGVDAPVLRVVGIRHLDDLGTGPDVPQASTRRPRGILSSNRPAEGLAGGAAAAARAHSPGGAPGGLPVLPAPGRGLDGRAG